MCPAGVLNGCRAPRWKGNGYTCAKCMPQNGLQSHSGQQVNFRNQRRIANPSPSAAFRSQAESAYRQYRAVRWVLLPEAELCLRPAATLDCKSCVAKWTRTGTGGRLQIQRNRGIIVLVTNHFWQLCEQMDWPRQNAKSGCLISHPLCGERGSRTYIFKKYHKIANH